MGMRTRVLGTFVVVASLALSASAAQAALDMFFEVPNQPALQGESLDKDHPHQIDVLAWSAGVSKAPSPTGAKTSPTLPSFKDLSFTKYLDRSSPAILQAVASGTTFSSAKLHILKAGGSTTPVEYVTLCFTGVRFTSQSLGGSGGEDRLTEDVSFAYQTMVEKYKQQGPTGQTIDTIFGGWDLVRNIQLGGPCD